MTIENLTLNEQKLRDLHLRKLALGEIQGPLTGYPSIDKKWLKYYTEEQIMSFNTPEMTMYQYMMKNRNHLDDNAICYFDKNITYQEFDKLVNQCANSFLKNGVSVGDKVTICMPNTPEALIAFYALNKIGAVANMIHPLSSQEEIKNFVQEVDSKMIITIDLSYDKVIKIADETNLEKIVVASPAESMPLMTKALYKIAKNNYDIISDRRKISWKKFINSGNLEIEENILEVPYEKDRLAVIIHTGGTTGVPKGVKLTNENFNSMVEQFFKNADNFSRGDKMLTIMPVFHGFGLCSSIHLPLSVGVTTILIPKLEKKSFHKLITKYKPNHIIGVPTLFKGIINNSKLSEVDFSFLKYVVSGGDFVTDSFEGKINEFLRERKSGAELSKGYGLSEAVAGVTFSYGEYNVIGSNGIPMVATNMKIVRPGTDEELKEGEIGEICIQGPTVMQGYYNNEEETNSTLINGWLHTGDLGLFDENGIFYFKQRKGNMIISSGVNVYPSNIEQVIEMHPSVAVSAVIGISHPYKLQVPKAYIELKPGYEANDELEQEIMALCTKHLNKYSIPCSLEFTNIPKTKLGKVSHSMLQEKGKN